MIYDDPNVYKTKRSRASWIVDSSILLAACTHAHSGITCTCSALLR